MANLAKAPESGVPAETRRVLVVGDDPATRHLLAAAGGPNRVVEFTRDGSAAASRIEREPFDLCVFGLRDAASSRLEFLRGLRRRHPQLKLLVLTTFATSGEVIEALREHAFNHLGLPVLADGLAEAIGRTLEEPPGDEGIEVVSARPAWVQLRLACRLRTAERALRFMNEWETGLPQKESQDLGTAFREMLLNAMEHGGLMNPEKTVEVSCVRTARLVCYEIRDPGDGFSMDSLRHAAVSNPTDAPAAHVLYRSEQAMRAGGFGILITKSLVDELIYNEKGNGVVLIKYLDSVPPSP